MDPGPPAALRDRIYAFVREVVLSPLDWSSFDAVVEGRRASRAALAGYIDTLPALACLAAGGDLEAGVPLSGSWLLFLLAARCFDDLIDHGGPAPWAGDRPASEVQAYGLHALGAAMAALSHVPAGAGVLAGILRSYGNAVALAARGQVERNRQPALTVEGYFENVAARTAMIVATAVESGALLSAPEPAPTVLGALHRYGVDLGIMLQILDDCADLRAHDLAAGRLTLPVIYALSQRDDPRWPRLQGLLDASARDAARDAAWIRETAALLGEMNALGWCLGVAGVYRQRALSALAPLPPAQVAPLVAYVDRSYAQFL